MEIWQAAGLGVIQGLTEFLPVSSSGHLVLFQHLFGIQEPALIFDIGVHVGTLVAVILYFRRDIASILAALAKTASGKSVNHWKEDPDIHLALMIAAGSIPTAVIGLGLKDAAERLFSSVWLVGVALLVTASLLLLTRLRHPPPSTGRHGGLTWMRAVAVGLVQGLAIVPGISRSGATIACGLLMGLQRESAARYSFLLSIPAVTGAGLLGSLDLLTGRHTVDLTVLSVGLVVSALVGYGALWMLVAVVQRGKMHYFAPYCALVGVLALIWASK